MSQADAKPIHEAPKARRAPVYPPILLPVLLAFMVLGTIYLCLCYRGFLREVKADAAALAELMAPLIGRPVAAADSGQPADPKGAESAAPRHMLTWLREKNRHIRFAYLFIQQGGQYAVLIDSGPAANSPDHVPPFQPYAGIGYAKETFAEGLSAVKAQKIGRHGAWISTLTPVRDPQTNEALAILCTDSPVGQWRRSFLLRAAPGLLVTLGIALLAGALGWSLIDRSRLKKHTQKLAVDAELFRAVFDQAPIGIAVTRRERLSFHSVSGNSGFNRMTQKIIGYPPEKMSCMSWRDITHPEDIPAAQAQYARLQSGETSGFSMEKRYLRPDGSVVWVNLMVSKFIDSTSQPEPSYLALFEDITARKKVEESLKESERSKAVLLSHLPGLAYRCRYDREWTMEFVSQGCLALTGYEPEALLYNRDLSYSDLIEPEDRERLWQAWHRALSARESFRQEYRLITKDGRRKWVLELGQGIFTQDGGVEALEGIVIDITSQKENEARILYMGEHDTLTGLYNRHYFERNKKFLNSSECLPLSVSVCDIDGLHLVNDVFGLEQGDRLIVETARLIESLCRKGDVLIRTGGDEFTLLMPRTGSVEAEQVNQRIGEAVYAYNAAAPKGACGLSLSIGCSTRTSAETSFAQTVKFAQENMHYHKLLERRSPHNSILSSVMATMLARSRETEAHCERLVDLSKRMGKRIGLGQKEMDELELYAMLHDIGKVGVDDRILNKPGNLTGEEWESMKKHSEIGYRIVASAMELAHVADYILSHHERWDGMGYPRGLSGEHIPLLSRILAIVDAYDAMIEDRAYRRAMASDAALAEIERSAGTQFDPALARLFVDILQG